MPSGAASSPDSLAEISLSAEGAGAAWPSVGSSLTPLRRLFADTGAASRSAASSRQTLRMGGEGRGALAESSRRFLAYSRTCGQHGSVTGLATLIAAAAAVLALM